MNLILRTLADAESGRGGVILISGEEGVGKTRLINEACRIAEKREFSAVRTETETLPLPGADRPVLTVIDDLHLCADQALLSRMTARLASLRHQPQVWLLTLREQAYGAGVHRFVRALEEWGCTRLPLGRLSQEAVRELLTDILGAAPAPGLMALADEAAGHPLLTVALAKGLVEDGRVRVAGQTAVVTSAAVPERLRSTVNCLLNDHSQGIQDMLRTAAVLGPEFSIGDLAAILVDVPPVHLAACVQRAVDADLLDCRSDDRLAFRYELVRRTIVESTALGVRQVLLHAASAPTPADRPPQPSAPRDPAPLSPQPARPLAAPPVVQEDSLAVLSARAVSFAQEGRMDQARESATAVLRGCAASGDASGQALARLVQSMCARTSGQAAEALRLSRKAAASIPPGTSDDICEFVANCAALELSLLGETAEAEQLLRKVGWEELSGAPPATMLLGTAAARITSAKGDHRKADQWAEAGLGVAGTSDGWLLPLAGAIRALAALRGGEMRAAVRLVARHEAESEPDRPALYAQPEWVALQVVAERHGPARCVGLLAGRYAHLIARPVLFVEEPGAAPWMVRTALAANAPQLAEEVVHAVRALADDNADFPPLTVSALHAEGLLRRDEDALARARSEHRGAWAAAGAAEDLGILLLDRGTEGGPSGRQFVAARELYEEAGALTDVARINEWLARQAPPVPPPTAPVDRSADPGQALTGSERAVADLVVLGMTNRQVAGKLHLSSYTVNYHLRNIFRKLGIKSRVELARWYQDRAEGTVWPRTPRSSRTGPTLRSGTP